MSTIRSFIAIELSDEARIALADRQIQLKKAVPPGLVRWTAPESIHLTLHFLGDIDPADVEIIGRVMATSAATCPPLSLRLAGLGCFPNTRRPRIVWIGVTGDIPPLAALQADLGRQLRAAIGFSPESRPFSPHLTIGRVKNNLPGRQLAQLGEALAGLEVGEVARLEVAGISLMKSELKPAGAVYTQLLYQALTGA